MMLKKIVASVALIATVAVSAAMFAAFEAHVINVTAHIENALKVDTEPIMFGTVFPQEMLYRDFDIVLSESFIGADRVDDVEYVIKQKMKPCLVVPVDPAYPNGDMEPIDPTCVPDTANATPPHNATGWHYLDLCQFLSKTNDDLDGQETENDTSHRSYYVDNDPVGPSDNDYCRETVDPDATGRLTKIAGDIADRWVVDLKVPPVDGYVGQDWPEGCPTIPDNDKTYGCDLWIEVTWVSETDEDNGDLACVDADVMLVLDRSGSVITELATLKTAAKDFVTALAPASDGTWMGQTSFADNGSLDLHLTSNVTAINNAIDGLSAGGFTNLAEGLTLATAELVNLDRTPDVDYPDYMVVITDGAPNRPTDETAAKVAATAAADAARAAGIKIYVVGVGTDTATADYLRNNIANSTGQYYDAANYAGLETILSDIATCTP